MSRSGLLFAVCVVLLIFIVFGGISVVDRIITGDWVSLPVCERPSAARKSGGE